MIRRAEKLDCFSVVMLFGALMGELLAMTKEHDLQVRLMANYNTNIFPTVNGSMPVEVNMQIFLESIVSIDEANEVLTSKAYAVLQWKDEYLKWNPSEFGNITLTMFKQKEIWLPDLVVANSVNEYKLLGIDDLRFAVYHDGGVIWTPGFTTTTVCPINTKYFPFDRQTCFVEILPWTSGWKNIQFTVKKPATTPWTHENGQWDLISTSSEFIKTGGYASIKYGLHFKRRSLYYITTVIVPVTFICILNCFTFLIPKQSGERIGYSITVFLSFVLIMTIINGILPKTSKEVSVFVIYLGVLLSIALLTITSSIFCLILEPLNDKENVNKKTGDDICECCKHFKMKDKETNKVEDNTGNRLKVADSEVEDRRKIQRKTVTIRKRVILFVAKYFEPFSFSVVCLSTILSTFITYIILLKP